jgi:16S rRNA (adenine(1408)-N(1))-methyltransferase
MADTARRAAAKPARGGTANAMFLQASLETLSTDLAGIAARITVNYPWGSLLKTVALPEAALLAALARLARSGATLDVLVNLHPLRDAAYAERNGLAGALILGSSEMLRAAYWRAGFRLKAIEDVTGSLVRSTRWGSQLHHAGREIVRLVAAKV